MAANEEIGLRFGRNLYLRRCRVGITQGELARRTSLHRTEVPLLERGERVPRLETLARLSAALDCSPEVFFEGIVWLVPQVPEGKWVPVSPRQRNDQKGSLDGRESPAAV